MLPPPQALHARLQGRAEQLEAFIKATQARVADDGIDALREKINKKEQAIATSLLPAPPGFPPGRPTARLETESAQLHRELHSLQQAEAELPAARQELAQVRQRLQAAALCVQDAKTSAVPAPGAQDAGPSALPTHKPTLGELLAQESREEQAQIVRTALQDGGAAMRRLSDRAARRHPRSIAERLRGSPKPMDGQRLDAFKGLVRADVLALAKTGRIEPRLAAGMMRKAVEEGTLGKTVLPEDRQLLLSVLDQMQEEQTAPSVARDAFAGERLPPVPLPQGYRYPIAVSMMAHRAGEETGAVFGTKVAYLDAQQRQQYQVHMHNGKLYDAQGELFDTEAAKTVWGGDGKAIFVMDPAGNMYASNHHVKGKFHHSSFVAGAPVAAAGEFEVHKGVVKSISRESGHYWPTAEQLDQMAHHLKSQGAADFVINQEV